MQRVTWILLLLACATPASAENKSLSALEPLLPVAPSAEQRNLRSGDTDFNRGERDPVAGFIDSISDSDAIIEIVLGRSRIITLKQPLGVEQGIPLIAMGDPTVADFDVAGPRHLRIVSKRVGLSDFTVTTDDGETFAFDVHVVYDIPLMQAYLQQIFPEALIKLRQLREHVVLEGQARSAGQVTQIVGSLQSYLRSLQPTTQIKGGTSRTPLEGADDDEAPPEEKPDEDKDEPTGPTPIDVPDDRPETQAEYAGAQIINLMTVPGVQQVMLKVQVAELNRSSLRRIGADLNVFDSGRLTFSTFISGVRNFTDETTQIPGSSTFGVFPSADVDFFINALRDNTIAKVLAEPTLVAMHGQEASFLAGGEFPFQVPQLSGGVTTITVQFKPFGVQLNFIPYILDDETIRLRVAPEVSAIDETVVTTLGQGQLVPGLETRAVNTTVELRQGQTLAIGGLLQVDLEARTQRIPGVGDLPYIGPFFSNTSHERVEKELMVLVTPHLVSPLECNEQYCLPGQEVLDPNDCEFYFLNRIEGRTGRPHRSPTAWDNPLGCVQKLKLESRAVCGPTGYSE